VLRPVSIVTVTFDTYFFVRLLVEKVREFVGSREYELIVVDRGSRDGTREWLVAQEDVRMLTALVQRGGHGHGEAAEMAALQARFEHVVLLDSDAHPIAPEWLELTVDKLDAHHRLAGALFQERHEGNAYAWYVHPHFMAFHRADVGIDVTLRKVRPTFDTGEEATVRLLERGLGVIWYPSEFCARFAVGHPHFPTVTAGVFHAWYGTRLAKEKRAVSRETAATVSAATYGRPLQAKLRAVYQLGY
jgi:glycosyltransferase involved in cell wall biosynthesis